MPLGNFLECLFRIGTSSPSGVCRRLTNMAVEMHPGLAVLLSSLFGLKGPSQSLKNQDSIGVSI